MCKTTHENVQLAMTQGSPCELWLTNFDSAVTAEIHPPWNCLASTLEASKKSLQAVHFIILLIFLAFPPATARATEETIVKHIDAKPPLKI